MKVVVAVVLDSNNRVLLTQRPKHVDHGGFWEFPGGKLEPAETPVQALIRELLEEVGIVATSYKYLAEYFHTYPVTARPLPTSRGLTAGSSDDARSMNPAAKPREVAGMVGGEQLPNSNKSVHLFVYIVNEYQGEPRCLEQQQDMQWVDVKSLANYELPEANQDIVNFLQNHVLVNLTS